MCTVLSCVLIQMNYLNKALDTFPTVPTQDDRTGAFCHRSAIARAGSQCLL